jgi:hypothetical protein
MTQQRDPNIFVCDDNDQSETVISCSDCLRSVFLSGNYLQVMGVDVPMTIICQRISSPKQIHSLEAESESRQKYGADDLKRKCFSNWPKTGHKFNSLLLFFIQIGREGRDVTNAAGLKRHLTEFSSSRM